jgi:O-antigen ligase
MFVANPLGLAAMLFGVQIVFTTSLLESISFYAGPFRLGVVDLLQIWVFFLWIGAFIDGDGRIGRTRSGNLILLLVSLSLFAFIHGVAAGYDAETAAVFLKTILGYMFFFPAMWIVKDRRNMKILVSTVLAASVVAAVWVILKGYIGGEGVYLRQTSGLRVSSREVNAVVIGLLLVTMLLWKRYRSVPAVPFVAAILVMGAAILLGQSRALWLAVFAGALMAFVADMSRPGEGGFKLSRLVSTIMLVVVFVGGSIAFVAAAGLLSAGDVAARSGGADGGLAGDVSLWARFLSWWEIIRTVTTSPFTLIFGTGFGHRITYFRPDLVAEVSIPYVDGSFFQLLLNLGLSGFLTLAFLYAGGIAGSFRTVLKTASERETVLALWLTASFTALTIAALSGSLITNYRFTSLWAFMFAILETIRIKPSWKS